MAAQGEIRIGTSGWIYRHWRGVYYPADLPAARWFAYYARSFDTVEINNTFYRLPSTDAFDEWKRQAPPGFLYAIKANRFLTHMKKLKDPAGPIENILGRARRLGPHLGPVLYQLPPRWKRNVPRLREFIAQLPADVRHVFEFRDPSWYCAEVQALLAEARMSFCIHDLGGAFCPHWLTGPLMYVRFHGPTEKAYAGRYGRSFLQKWAEEIASVAAAGRDVYAYFNNDQAGSAVANALELKSLLGQEPEATSLSVSHNGYPNRS